MNNVKVSNKKLLLSSLIYSCSGILMKCFSFFLLPLYTAYLTTDDYGITSLVTSFISTMSFVVTFSLFSAIMRFYVDLKDNPEKLSRFYGTIVIFISLSGVAFGTISTIFREFISKTFFSSIDYYPIIFVCLISLVFSCLHTVFDGIMRSQQKALKSSVFSLIVFGSNVLLNVIFVVIFEMGAFGVILATLIVNLGYSIYFIIELSYKKELYFCLDLKLLKSALKYSIPIMPHNLSTHIALFVSKILIGDTASLTSLGLYSVASQFGNIADTIHGYVSAAYSPWMYEQLKEKQVDLYDTTRRTVNLLIAVISLFFIGIALFAQDYILLFVEKSYATAWHYVPLIVTVFAIKTVYYFYVDILFYYKEASKKLFIATVSSSLLNLLISFYLIPLYGVYGSIIADGIGMLLRVIIVVVISKKYNDVGLKLRDFVLNFTITVIFVYGGLFLSYTQYSNEFSLLNLSYKFGIVIIYIFYIGIRYQNEIWVQFNSIKKMKF